jgi:PAS domain S-box-containing protein
VQSSRLRGLTDLIGGRETLWLLAARSQKPAMHLADHERLSLRDLDTRTLLDLIGGHALIVSPCRRIRWLNRAPIGRGLPEFIDHDLLDSVDESQREFARHAFERVLTGAPPIELELRGAQDGRWYWARFAAIEQRGNVQAVFVHSLDIDEAKRTQTALAIERARRKPSVAGDSSTTTSDESRRRFEQMADALPVLISYVDAERRYQYNNASYEHWFGVSREQLRGRCVEEVLGSVAYAGIRTYVDAALAGQVVSFESTVPYKDAGLRRVLARYVPDVTEDGRVAGFHALIEDVTAQRDTQLALRRREDELRQVQRLEALGRLAAGVAHEFNNLLWTVITGCAAASEMCPTDSPLASMVARIKRAAERGTTLTRQLLSFGRSGTPRAGPLELDAITADTAALLQRLVGSGVCLEADLDGNAWIVADAGQLQQILINLVINARDAMPDGGHVRLATRRTRITADQAGPRDPGDYVVLSVEDTGFGMDEQTRARIFDPFFTTKAPGQGTGLGLSTVYGIVRSVGGYIDVASAPGQGTTFSLMFPICDPP